MHSAFSSQGSQSQSKAVGTNNVHGTDGLTDQHYPSKNSLA